MIVGCIAEVVLPGLASEIDEGSGSGRALWVKRAIIHSRLWCAEWRNDPAAIEGALLDRWRSDVGEAFYTVYTGRFDRWFCGPHYRLVNALADAVSTKPDLCRLVEVGTVDVTACGGKFQAIDIDKAFVDKNLVSAPAWPAHPDWLAKFLKVLGTKVEA